MLVKLQFQQVRIYLIDINQNVNRKHVMTKVENYIPGA